MFVVSWVNPDETLAHKEFDDYLTEGIVAALDAVEAATGEHEVHGLGYCIGGTLIGVALGYLAGIGDQRLKTATMFTAQVDFSEPGDLAVFIDEKQLDSLDQMMGEKGYLEAQAMFTTFNMLRANDLIWSFFVSNYLLGKEPQPFDLLHWNADATRMPRKMHLFYLRQMYLHNNLVKPGAITLAGVPIDLTKVTVPVYLQATPGRSHRAVPLGVQGAAQFLGARALRAGGFGPHRRRHQSARRQQVPVLAEPGRALGDRPLAARRRRAPRQLVARLARLAGAPVRRDGAGAQAGRREAAGARRCARRLREEPLPVGAPSGANARPMDTVDCVVIGAGVIGLAVGRALANRGLEVVVVEAADAIGTGNQQPQLRSHPRGHLLPGGFAEGPAVRHGPRAALPLLRGEGHPPPSDRQADRCHD